MDDLLNLVKDQHRLFGIQYEGGPRNLELDEKRFRFACFIEEATEYLLADDLEDEYDALLDLLVFVIGTLERQGLPMDGFREVVLANMKKELGPNGKRGGFELDLRKPEGWESPDLSPWTQPNDHT
jgi:predicted HAD superfamily Cof-like phosphohydrolase